MDLHTPKGFSQVQCTQWSGQAVYGRVSLLNRSRYPCAKETVMALKLLFRQCKRENRVTLGCACSNEAATRVHLIGFFLGAWK